MILLIYRLTQTEITNESGNLKMNIDYKKCFNVVHAGLKTNVNDMTIAELQRMSAIIDEMKTEHDNDDYGVSNAFMTNLKSMIDYMLIVKQNNE
jgi:hypothetical protein